MYSVLCIVVDDVDMVLGAKDASRLVIPQKPRSRGDVPGSVAHITICRDSGVRKERVPVIVWTIACTGE